MRLVVLLFISSFSMQAQVEAIKADQLLKLLNNKNDTTYIVNFWATWCGPCVKELPYFEKLNAEYKNKPVKVILVSLDFNSQLNSRVVPFVNKKELKSSILLMNESDPNTWIDKVDKTWSGAIPATVIFNKTNKIFYEKDFETYDELLNTVKPFLKK